MISEKGVDDAKWLFWHFTKGLSHPILTRCHGFSLFFFLGFISDPDKYLKGIRISLSMSISCTEVIIRVNRHSSWLFTSFQVSRIMTSSVARSSWVSSPGTSSIWEDEEMVKLVFGFWSFYKLTCSAFKRLFHIYYRKIYLFCNNSWLE